MRSVAPTPVDMAARSRVLPPVKRVVVHPHLHLHAQCHVPRYPCQDHPVRPAAGDPLDFRLHGTTGTSRMYGSYGTNGADGTPWMSGCTSSPTPTVSTYMHSPLYDNLSQAVLRSCTPTPTCYNDTTTSTSVLPSSSPTNASLSATVRPIMLSRQRWKVTSPERPV